MNNQQFKYFLTGCTTLRTSWAVNAEERWRYVEPNPEFGEERKAEIYTKHTVVCSRSLGELSRCWRPAENCVPPKGVAIVSLDSPFAIEHTPPETTVH